MKKVHENVSECNAEVRTEHRDRIDLLRSRVDLLKGKDKVLMTMYMENGNSFRQMARLVGVNEVSIARRIHKVTKRLINGEYIMCLRSRDKFDKNEMDVAKDYFLAGLSMKKIARKHNTTYYCVRKTLKKIQGIIAFPQTKTAVSA
ncbi:MAG: hypothetical protein WC454_06865 [Phycisphaerae bacterium]|jgi:predicted DNA-binding protein YlxM (UPF0122 family)